MNLKHRRKLIRITAALVLIALAWINCRSYLPTTFDQAATRHHALDLREVRSVEIIRQDSGGEQTITLTGSAQVQRLLAVFNGVKLRKSGSSPGEYQTVYWITLRGDNYRQTGIILYDHRYMIINAVDSDIPKDRVRSFKILSGLDNRRIDDLFTR
ncbi:hypothetical protein F4V43_18135 [Paenibacillus spiritus]|uniref:Uncharacterized protein n=1 Tax=Paenibacillus spiritus TaxID=2496557 RepID=A0A5J5FUI9_9BACL|nr:hypothetical protein [Paenibacillus spiritus]KAA8997212.1 hypothetical protein F4V43_18135 [Paenibacillus spiritus]